MEPESDEIPYVFKILLLGDGGVGKTSLLRRFIDNIFDPDYQSTIGVQFMTRVVKFDNRNVKLVIWDIAGQSKHTTYRHLYYKAANGIILVYDITRPETFYNLPRWVEDAQKSVDPTVRIAVLGNKSDLIRLRTITTTSGNDYAYRINAELFSETSAKSGEHVEEAFLALARALVNRSDNIQQGWGDEYR